MPTLDDGACAALLDALTEIARSATQAIRDLSGQRGSRRKADGSPVTAADEAAEDVIREGLHRLAPAVPIISEEQTAGEAERAKALIGNSVSYFLVDPLDGTREFISGSDEYTVNIAVITNGAPILGVITAPALRLAWRGILGRGAERIELGGGTTSRPSPIHARARPKDGLVVMASRSHLDARTRAYLDRFPQAKLVQCGSSVKFCRLADGSADLYPRLAPTHDWDIAAGHAILEAAGGRVTTPEGAKLLYGTPELLIPAFVASGDAVTA